VRGGSGRAGVARDDGVDLAGRSRAEHCSCQWIVGTRETPIGSGPLTTAADGKGPASRSRDAGPLPRRAIRRGGCSPPAGPSGPA
jgi:hypothetical protein